MLTKLAPLAVTKPLAVTVYVSPPTAVVCTPVSALSGPHAEPPVAVQQKCRAPVIGSVLFRLSIAK